jgi:hypothetical protein
LLLFALFVHSRGHVVSVENVHVHSLIHSFIRFSMFVTGGMRTQASAWTWRMHNRFVLLAFIRMRPTCGSWASLTVCVVSDPSCIAHPASHIYLQTAVRECVPGKCASTGMRVDAQHSGDSDLLNEFLLHFLLFFCSRFVSAPIGHCGPAASRYLAEHLSERVAQIERPMEEPSKLKELLLDMDAEFLHKWCVLPIFVLHETVCLPGGPCCLVRLTTNETDADPFRPYGS